MFDDKIEIENVNTPGRTECVDRVNYTAMREALLDILPYNPPGIKGPAARDEVLPLIRL